MRRIELLHVLSVQRCGRHSLRLRFNDGTTRRVNLLPALSRSRLFRQLRDPRVFARFKLDACCGTPEWQNGVAFAPEFLRELPEEPDPARMRGNHRNGTSGSKESEGPVRRFRGCKTVCTRAYWLEDRRWAAKVRTIDLHQS